VIPEGDWNAVQKPLLEAWERQHELEAHGGEDVVWDLDPDPMDD
jgi:hypothetical protein